MMRAPDETRPRRRQKKHRRGSVPMADEVVGKAALAYLRRKAGTQKAHPVGLEESRWRQAR